MSNTFPISNDDDSEDDERGKDNRHPKDEDILLDIVGDHEPYVFVDQTNYPFVKWIDGDQIRTADLKEFAFVDWLREMFYQRTDRPVHKSALDLVLDQLASQARRAKRKFHLEPRMARGADGVLYYSLNNDKQESVRIDRQSWNIVEQTFSATPLHRTYSHMKEQIKPIAGLGGVKDILQFVNIKNSEDQLLFQVWLVLGLIPDVPRPILAVHGAQGSGKSCLGDMIVSLIDPSLTPRLTAPKLDQAPMVHQKHYLAVIDNLPDSYGGEYSDFLCRVVTGDSHEKRQLYTDSDSIIYSYKRLVVTNGLNSGATRSDLLDRQFSLELYRLDEYIEERELMAEFEKRKPAIFGAMLDGLSDTLRHLDTVSKSNLTRLADWHIHGRACAQALGYGVEAFDRAWKNNLLRQNRHAIESSIVGRVLHEYMKANPEKELTGTPTGIWQELQVWGMANEHIKSRDTIEGRFVTDKNWPDSPQVFSNKLLPLIADFDAIGIRIIHGRATAGRYWEIHWDSEIPIVEVSEASEASLEAEDLSIDADAFVTYDASDGGLKRLF